MSKRFASADEIDAAPTLSVQLPASKHASDPISWGSRPEVYEAADLKKIAVSQTNRTHEFKQRMIAIWWVSGSEFVPFLFRTSDGVLRSLDAGCVGFLLHHQPAECEAVLDNKGFVIGVVPTAGMISQFEPVRQRLIDQVLAK